MTLPRVRERLVVMTVDGAIDAHRDVDRKITAIVRWGTVGWVLLSLVLAWLPLLHEDRGIAKSAFVSLCVTVLVTCIFTTSAWWWFQVGWLEGVATSIRVRVVVLGALGMGWGSVAVVAFQMLSPIHATGFESSDPGIGDFLAAPFTPILIAIPALVMVWVGRAARETSGRRHNDARMNYTDPLR
jgi:hypothetical protein